MRGDPDELDDTAPTSQPAASRTPAAPPAALTYEDGLRHAHDFLRGTSQTNPFAGRKEYGDLATGKTAPVTPVPSSQKGIGTTPEPVLDNPGRPGGMSMISGPRNIVKETIGAPGAATNQTNFPAGLPRVPATNQTPEVGGTRAVLMPRARNQRATEPSEPAFFASG